jgi:hypothetical protein
MNDVVDTRNTAVQVGKEQIEGQSDVLQLPVAVEPNFFNTLRKLGFSSLSSSLILNHLQTSMS